MLETYPQINYNGDVLTDISRRFIIKNIKTRYSKDIFFEYLIENWKAPESIAYDFYGSCDYVWLVLVANNIVDPIGDWLLTDDEVKNLIVQKYGIDHIYDNHHWERDGVLYTSEVPGSVAVTNYDYENDVNEKKRKILLVYPEIVASLEKEARSLFK